MYIYAKIYRNIYIEAQPIWFIGDMMKQIGENLRNLLGNISEEKNGFKFGKTWRFSEKSLGVVVPILRTGCVERNYVTQSEAKDKVKITDKGTIDRLKVENKGKDAVFIRTGTIFEGDTQERGVTSSMIVEPETEEIEIGVRCVHASKGINTGSVMGFVGFAPRDVTITLCSSAPQHEVWSSVRHEVGRTFSAYAGSNDNISVGIGNDDLVGNMKKIEGFKGNIDEMLKKVPFVDNQIGAVIFDHNGVLGMEFFDSSKSWEAIHREIISKYGDELSKEQAEPIFELKEKMVKKKILEFIGKLLVFTEKTVVTQRNSETRVIEGTDVVGEYTILKDDVIHFLAMRKET